MGEVSPADPSDVPSTPLISDGGEFNSVTTPQLSQPLPVTIPSGNTEDPFIVDRVREPVKLPTYALDPSAAPEDTSSRESAASATANVILSEVKESSDAYTPLKSIARYLCIILDNCEVWFPPIDSIHSPHSYTSEQW